MRRQLTFILLFVITLTTTAQVYVLGKPKVFVQATAQTFNNPNSKFAVQLKKSLRENGWIVVNKQSDAEYTLIVTAEAREYKQEVATYETEHNILPVTDSVTTTVYDRRAEGAAAGNAYGYGSRVEKRNSITETTEVKTDYVDIQTQGEVKDYMYFVYMDTYITFSFGDEVLYEDVLEVKDGHTKSYEEAALVASKQAINQITEILPTKLKRRI